MRFSIFLSDAISNAVVIGNVHTDYWKHLWGKRSAEAHSASTLNLSPLDASGGFLVTVCCVKRIVFGTPDFIVYVMFNSF